MRLKKQTGENSYRALADKAARHRIQLEESGLAKKSGLKRA